MDASKSTKEITIKRVSAFKFEIEVSSKVGEEEEAKQAAPVERISVIQRAPPSTKKRPHEDVKEGRKRSHEDTKDGRKRPRGEVEEQLPSYHDFQTRERALVPPGAVLIKDAIMYRIVEILLLKVLGEHQLKICGYPTAPTYKVLWGAVYRSSPDQGMKNSSPYPQDHDCKGDMACFLDHVCRFLERCAPTKELWHKFGWTNLSVETIMRKIYYEQLVPFLGYLDLRQNQDILHSNADIVLLEKWQAQGFTAVSWNGQKHFAQLSPETECDAGGGRCVQCRHGTQGAQGGRVSPGPTPPSAPGHSHGGFLWHAPHPPPQDYLQ